MTLQQKKERAIRLKLISALSLCLFFLFVVPRHGRARACSRDPLSLSGHCTENRHCKMDYEKAGWGYAPHPFLLQPARLPAGLLLRRGV